MAESAAAQRMRRLRAHKTGDHSLCSGWAKCDAAAAAEVRAAAGEPMPGSVAEAVAATVAELNFEEGDPRLVSGRIAVRLAREFDKTGNPSLGRELQVILTQIAEIPNQPPGPVDESRLRWHRRRVEQLLSQAAV